MVKYSCRQVKNPGHIIKLASLGAARGIVALANDIRRYRFDSGEMSQKELAELVGVSRQTINAIEGGKYSPSLEVAFRIARAFGASIEDVFDYEAEIDGERAYAEGMIVGVSWDGKDTGGET